jgi:hypothetical protein
LHQETFRHEPVRSVYYSERLHKRVQESQNLCGTDASAEDSESGCL